MTIMSCRPGADEPAFPAWLASRNISESEKSELDVTLKQPISKKYEGHPIGWLEIFPIFSGVKMEHLIANRTKTLTPFEPSPLNHPHRSTRKTNPFGRLRNEWFRSSLGMRVIWGQTSCQPIRWPSYFSKWVVSITTYFGFLGFAKQFILIIKFCALRSEIPNSEQTVGTSYNKYQLDHLHVT